MPMSRDTNGPFRSTFFFYFALVWSVYKVRKSLSLFVVRKKKWSIIFVWTEKSRSWDEFSNLYCNLYTVMVNIDDGFSFYRVSLPNQIYLIFLPFLYSLIVYYGVGLIFLHITIEFLDLRLSLLCLTLIYVLIS